MHILHIFDHSIPLHSGYAFRSLAILQQQWAMGWKTSHITGGKQKSGEILEEHVEGIRFFRTPPKKGKLIRLPIVNQIEIVSSLSKRLEDVIKIVKPNILHAHSPVLNGLAALKVAQRINIPLVYEVRAFWEDAAVDHGTSREWGGRYLATRALETYVLKRVDAITTICEGLRSEIIGRGISAEKITVIPNAVDIGNFQIGKEPDPHLVQELGLEDRTVLGFIGSFYAYEGLTLLLKALPLLVHDHPNLKVLLVGGGPQDAELRTLAAELGIQDHVVFTGRIPHNQVQRYYDLVDIFIYPRLPMRLTELVTPLKPLEAMAQGKLVIASDVGGHRELIRHSETGQLFEAGDVNALAATVFNVLDNKESWPEWRRAARLFVETERNWSASVMRYRAVYESVYDRSFRTSAKAQKYN